MYNNPSMQYTQIASSGLVRILHAVPDGPNVDIYANDQLIANNLAFGEYTDYMSLPEGTYDISLYVTGTNDSPVISSKLIVNRNNIFTVVANGYLSDIGFIAIRDANMPNVPSLAMIRFAHLAPNSPAVDITLPDGTILIYNLSSNQLRPYLSAFPTNYTLEVRLAGTTIVLLSVPNVNLEPNEFYTVYILGEKLELEALLLLDGNQA